ncbi:DUF2306 domain-containing protein [Thalassotalea atypica]|uniref:DUF2306 domain-containing protein n=1 Tax=Thalassotalea atypica TaxID=2054316 RepID=UPI0025742BD4|nr:DUF2306 domain-containing protein [Thalassotalea atypica]
MAEAIIAASNNSTNLNTFAKKSLKHSAQIWFFTAIVGQLFFVYYLVSFYGISAINGNLEQWNKVLPHGYVPGEIWGNIAVIIHILFAIVMITAGALQFIPQIRQRAPKFHRINGRVYLSLAVALSITGVFMVWTKNGVGDLSQHISITINGLLILAFAALTVKYAIKRKIDIHRRWALRLFMVVSGVWFFRVGLMFWLLVNGGPVGFDPKTFAGPFLTFLAISQYAIPLLGVELYVRAQKTKNNAMVLSTSLFIICSTIVMGIGIFGAAMGMWLPRIS